MMQGKKIIDFLYWAILASLFFWFAYTKGWILTNFESIDAKQAMIRIEQDANLTLLDVRTIQEYKQGHLRDAILIPAQVLDKNLGMLKQDKDKQILVYCATGNRSVTASRILENNGFTAINVRGGISSMQGLGIEIVK